MTIPYWFYILIITLFVLCYIRSIRAEPRLTKTLEKLNDRVTRLDKQASKAITTVNLSAVKRTNELDDEILKMNRIQDHHRARLEVLETLRTAQSNEITKRLISINTRLDVLDHQWEGHSERLNNQRARLDILDHQWEDQTKYANEYADRLADTEHGLVLLSDKLHILSGIVERQSGEIDKVRNTQNSLLGYNKKWKISSAHAVTRQLKRKIISTED